MNTEEVYWSWAEQRWIFKGFPESIENDFEHTDEVTAALASMAPVWSPEHRTLVSRCGCGRYVAHEGVRRSFCLSCSNINLRGDGFPITEEQRQEILARVKKELDSRKRERQQPKVSPIWAEERAA